MSDLDPKPITADSLRRREEWRAVFPAARMLWEEAADEGRGISFDGLDPSAMTRAMFATSSSWAEVLAWYMSVLAPLGWHGREVKPTWFEWTSTERPGERIDLLDRGRWERLPGWTVPEEQIGQLGFEVLFTARGAFSEALDSNDA